MNPFLGKTLTELRDGVPGYSDDELNALKACVCGGEWIRSLWAETAKRWSFATLRDGLWRKPTSPATGRRETEAACVAALTEWIEGDGND